MKKPYYEKNRKREIAKVQARQKKNNYKYEKTPIARMRRNIKRKTRCYFPLKGHLCEFCGAKATEHHHNSEPIEFDKFNFTCHKCHVGIHRVKRLIKLKWGKK